MCLNTRHRMKIDTIFIHEILQKTTLTTIDFIIFMFIDFWLKIPV